jgi:hypothetical protein
MLNANQFCDYLDRYIESNEIYELARFNLKTINIRGTVAGGFSVDILAVISQVTILRGGPNKITGYRFHTLAEEFVLGRKLRYVEYADRLFSAHVSYEKGRKKIKEEEAVAVIVSYFPET